MKKRILALLLCFTLLLGLLPAALTAAADGETFKVVDGSGNAASYVEVPQNGKITLGTRKADSVAAGAYQWQISIPNSDNLWANIAGAQGSSLELSYAMVANMLQGGLAYVRCRLTAGGETLYTAAVSVAVSYAAAPQPALMTADVKPVVISEAQPIGDPVITPISTPASTPAPVQAAPAAPANDAPAADSTAEGDSTPAADSTPEGDTTGDTPAANEGAATDTPAPGDTPAANEGGTANETPADNGTTTTETPADNGGTTTETPTDNGGTSNEVTPSDSGSTDNSGTVVTNDLPDVMPIVINYVFADGTLAASSWTATVPGNAGYSREVKSPEIVGYTPDYPTVTVNADPTDQSTWTYTVTYSPAEVEFKVLHYLQNVNDDGYALSETELIKGRTESTVGAGFQNEHPGFYALNYDETVTIAADGSTEVEIYYDRYYYLTNFDLDGGYGVEPIYARYGTPVDGSSLTPTKPGYTFGGWQPALPSTMPVGGSVHKAQWNAGNATYLVQYWLENANDDGYSYDSSIQRSAQAGSIVNGSGDKSYTGFHYDRADQNVTINGDGTSVVNVYYKRNTYTLTFKVYERSGIYVRSWNTKAEFENVKYGEDTSKYWSQAPTGYRWCTSTSTDTSYTYAPAMPSGNLTVYGESVSNTYKYTIHYYEEGTTNKVKEDNTYYRSSNGYNLTDEDYIYIPGFTCLNSGRTDSNSNLEYFVYYRRNSYKLDFNNKGDIVGTKTVPYEKALSSYNFTPDYPDGLEKNAYKFDGWYTDPGCTVAVDWATATMPYQNTILYAKWSPVIHTVTFAKNEGEGPEQTEQVAHNAYSEGYTTTNPPFEFIGWFYKDEGGVEHAFALTMPVVRDMDLYAKWRSDVMADYVIHYQLEDGTPIAADTTGKALANTTKTFDAKTGTALYEDYQSGYFPKTNSHSLTIDANGNNKYTFVYVQKEKVKYIVRYLEKETNTVLSPEKTGSTSDAVITEKFVPVTGYAPDAYQKQLVLSADEIENVITFWYVKDEVHAPVQIIHWTQNIVGEGYTEYQSSTDLNGVIGDSKSENALTIPGFIYVKGTAVAGETTTEFKDPATPSAVLTADGLVLNLYYDRIEYPYEFKFLEQGTDEVLADSVTDNARYQGQVTENAKDIPGYVLASDSRSQTITIAIEDSADTASKNVRIFYYQEQKVEIKYEVVAPTGEVGGELTLGSEEVPVFSGSPIGSVPTPKTGFRFAGWYKEAACGNPVPFEWVDSANGLTPGKTANFGTEDEPKMGYESATYYAKFVWDEVDLTIYKTGADTTIDENQSFIFKVTGSGIGEIEVVIHGDGSAKITGLKVGTEYTVTEVSGWSWRYKPEHETQKITLEGGVENQVTFTNKRENGKWLSGDNYQENRFTK